MRVLVISLCKESLSKPEYVQPILRALGIAQEDHDIEVSDYTADLVEKAARSDAIIISGTALRDFDYLKHLDSFAWLRDVDTPVLGICAGMQVLTLTYGGRLDETSEIGMIPIHAVIENPLFDGTFHAYTNHSKTPVPNANFKVLARSEDCVQAIRHRTKPQYGILFHPEVRNEQIILNFITEIAQVNKETE